MKTISTIRLLELLDKARNENNQELINLYAYELTTRVYVPNPNYTFEDVLYNFGYKMKLKNMIEAEENKQITIDDIMRGRNENI